MGRTSVTSVGCKPFFCAQLHHCAIAELENAGAPFQAQVMQAVPCPSYPRFNFGGDLKIHGDHDRPDQALHTPIQ